MQLQKTEGDDIVHKKARDRNGGQAEVDNRGIIYEDYTG